MIRKLAITASRGSTSSSRELNIFTGSVTSWILEMNRAMISSSNTMMKAMIAPAAIPLQVSGSVTLKNACHQLAPSDMAVSSSDWSKERNRAAVISTMNGRPTTM